MLSMWLMLLMLLTNTFGCLSNFPSLLSEFSGVRVLMQTFKGPLMIDQTIVRPDAIVE